MFVVALFVFAMLRLFAGSPAAVIAGDHATPEDILRVQEQLGLNKPIIIQFFHWLDSLVHLDLGHSLFSNLPVTTLIMQRLGPSLSLMCATLLLTVIVSIPLGTIAAWKAGSLIDRGIMFYSVAGFSIPIFVIGYVLIYIFSMQLHLFPVQGYKSLFIDGPGPFFTHLILPTLSLSTVFIALITRMTRACVLDVIKEDYIRTAYAKGQSNFKILLFHALPNAAAPIITTIGTMLIILIGGVVITESVYNIPGIGRLVLDAVLARDYPLIQGLILFFSFSYIMVNLLIDLSYAFFDPRIRL